MKKILPIVLICFVIIMGCSGKKTDSKETNDKTVFWLDKLSNAEVLTKFRALLNDMSGLDVEVNNYNDVSSYQTAVSQSIDSDSSPDLITWWSGEQLESLVEANRLLPIDDLWEELVAMGVPDDVKSALSYNGKIYAAPFSVLNNVCIYNMNNFEKAGIEKTPETFDEFLDVCQKLLDAGIIPIGIKNDSWASFIWFEAFIAAKNPQLYIDICNGTKKYTDDEVFEVMAIWDDMIKKGYFSEPVGAADVVKEFALGTTSMVIEPQIFVASVRNDYGLTEGVDFDAFVLPSMDPKDKDVIFFEVSPLAISAKSGNIDNAKILLKSFFSKEIQTLTLEEMGVFAVTTIDIPNPTTKKMTDFSLDKEKYQSILRYYENTPSELRDVAVNELSKFMAQRQDIKTTLEIIQKKADEVFNN